MRKMALLGLLVITCLALAAAPAYAQKDPFHPVIDPNAATTGSTTTTTTTGGDTTFTPPVIGSEGLANTGTDVTPWLAIAYALVVLGAGTLVLTRMYQPHPARR